MKINFKNTKIISAIGFLILIALIWFIGPFFGLSAEGRLKLISGVMVLWVLSLLIGQVIAMRAGGLIEKMLRRQADEAVMQAGAARRAEVKLLRERMLSAIRTLKTSRLGKLRGSAALYELPWYMIIGHPAAGKSTALRNSGLVFPFDEQETIQGIGGTQNCDWFFSTEGILLDTAGRYATQNEDRAEWLGFLKLLKRYRNRAPVNGILIATSLPELVNHNSEDFAAYAHKLRERIHEIEDIFELRVPCYLVFTKLDLLGGFAQFFEGTGEAGRNRVWGVTLPHEQEEDFDVRREANKQCELLYRGIRHIGEEYLTLSRGTASKPALFSFPLEFHALKDGIGRLIGLLNEDDPYHAKPMLRGIYFTSALQSGEPRIAAAERVSKQFDLTHTGFAATRAPASNSYFLRDLFREVLFPDQHLVMRQTRPGAARMRLASILASTAVFTICLSLLAQSYLSNHEMLSNFAATQAQTSTVVAGESLIDKLKGLAEMQKHLEDLEQYRTGSTPLRLSAGLYQGDRVEHALREEYFNGVRAVMLDPLQNNLETLLKQLSPVSIAGDPATGQPPRISSEDGYNALKTYLMLSTRPHLDAAFLATQVPQHWRGWLESQRGIAAMEDIEPAALGLLGYYLTQIAAPDLPLIEGRPPVIEDARLALRSAKTPLPARELVYEELKKRANARFPALTVARILEGKDGTVLGGTAIVPGALTREAWEKYMRFAIAEASLGEIKGDDWVLAVTVPSDPAKDGDANKNRIELEALYRQDYAEAWTDFLEGLTIAANPGSIAQASRMLERLGDPRNSPLKLVLQRAAYETSWDNPGQLSQSVTDTRQTLLSRTGLAGTPPNAQQNIRYGVLGRQFMFLNRIADSDPQSTPLLAGYLDHILKLKGQLAPAVSSNDQSPAALRLMLATLSGSGSGFVDTMQYVDNTLLTSVEDEEIRAALRQLFARSLILSYATLLPPVEEALNEAWQSEVYGQWQGLADKFPFSNNAQHEARIGEIVRFIGPGGTINKFIDEKLSGLIVKRGGQLIPRTWSEVGVRFNTAFIGRLERMTALGGALAQEGTSEASRFELRPVPIPGISDIIIEIDGQLLRYRMGPQFWQPFNWPGNDSEGARIQVVAFNGTTTTVTNRPGRMGLMRMFGDSARSLDASMNAGQIEWRFRGQDGTQSVKLDFRMVSGLNPMLLSSLGQGDLPRRITQ
jgi:type VI secretion system protein ImpL